MKAAQLHLASASPRRREILTALGVAFSFAGEDVDEQPRSGERAADLVARLAHNKAQAAQGTHREVPILGADTVVVLDERIFGKPESAEQAQDMLLALSGRTHEVLTAVALLNGESAQTVLCRSAVRFRDISREEAAAYWRSGEPRDKAGAYAVQGLGGVFVAGLQGSYSGVVGLPVFETAELLRTAGIDVLRRTTMETTL